MKREGMEFSSTSIDETDVFNDPRVKRIQGLYEG